MINLGYDLTDPRALISFRLSIAMIAIATLAIAIINSGWRTVHHNLERLANEDSLTGLLNRGGTIEVLNDAVYGGKTFSLITGDIDHFKSINDTFGHNIGDEVLRTVSPALTTGLGHRDGAGRIGGEEFAIIIHGPLHEATAHAEAIRERLLKADVTDFLGKPVPFTMSFGVAEFEPGADSVEMLRRADNALYQAKRSGRNRVMEYTTDLETIPASTVKDRRQHRQNPHEH